MITHSELIAVINAEWPHLVHGKDFWVGQPVADGSGEQIGPAFIVAWNVENIGKPEGEVLEGLLVKHASVINREPTIEEIRAAMTPLTPRQLRLAIVVHADISLASVQAAIDAIPDPTEREAAQVEWDYATKFERLHPTILRLGASLGLTPEQIDDLWVIAETL